MIKLDFVEPDSDTWRAWITECEAARNALVAQVDRGEDAEVSVLFKDERMKRVYICDGPPFYGKCAYCESRILGSQPGDIEHFRPKNRVTYEDGRVVMIERAPGAPVPHPGYYWLAYERRNLLYACADCNRPSSLKTAGVQVGKWDKFPVVGEYATRPGAEADEHPLLLNPLLDDPDEHVSIDDTGIMSARTARGEVSIRILGLNIREALVKDRIDAIGETRNAILAFVTACLQRNNIEQSRLIEKLKLILCGGASFGLARRYALRLARVDAKPFFDLLGASN